jgi:hypothetical protein
MADYRSRTVYFMMADRFNALNFATVTNQRTVFHLAPLSALVFSAH